MLIIPIKDGENIDRALKRFKRKFDKTGTKKSLQTGFITFMLYIYCVY